MLRETTESVRGVSGECAATSTILMDNQEVFSQSLRAHVPRSISVGSALVFTPSKSSNNVTQSTSAIRIIDDDTEESDVAGAAALEVRDSTVESSRKAEESPEIPSGCRKISFSGCDGVIAPAAKRIRADPSLNGLPSTTVGVLAQPEDSSALNALHVFVRQQIEIFAASSNEMAQPAPGRKIAIRLNQVGLRCIHCKDLPPKDRVKRATCYPSCVGRVYHSVSDMKFDHFPNCKGLSAQLKAKFDALRAEGKRGGERRSTSGSSSSTAQYYHDSARRMGLEDRSGGIFMSGQGTAQSFTLPPQTAITYENRFVPNALSRNAGGQISMIYSRSNTMPAFAAIPGYHASMAAFHHVTHGFHFRDHPVSAQAHPDSQSRLVGPRITVENPPGVPLGTEADRQYLNPLHCFVRRNVEVFVATNDDISAPSPGRKTRVGVGQVGIRCIHCAKLPPKARVKRAVCYPPSVSAIYHSVSNMKFDHFGSCRGLPEEARLEFSGLRASFNRRGGSTSNGSRGMSNSTAQYYHDSALRLGLKDSAGGIRFSCSTINLMDQRGPGASDGISALMMAARKEFFQGDYEQKHKVTVSAV
ncbi:hypothetical protein MHU86_6988 [Fragilaria crotonensis]|nr:hypothetical protein MHU86_6988 [Fragilaria crotonensis]